MLELKLDSLVVSEPETLAAPISLEQRMAVTFRKSPKSVTQYAGKHWKALYVLRSIFHVFYTRGGAIHPSEFIPPPRSLQKNIRTSVGSEVDHVHGENCTAPSPNQKFPEF